MNKTIQKALLLFQKNEISEYHVYSKLAARTADDHNRQLLQRIAEDEHRHYCFLADLTQREVRPSWIRIFWYITLAYIFGLSFALKLMEKGEKRAEQNYLPYIDQIEGMQAVIDDEENHENELLGVLEEERLEYAGAMVLGLNDALVELTGALAGLTFALQNNTVVAVTGLITGFAASLSMAASGYLSSKEEFDEDETKNPIVAAIYTGVAYIITVLLLIAPYFIFSNIYISLVVMLGVGILIIWAYTFYITTAKGLNFWRRFSEMAVISISVAVISFLAGIGAKAFFGVEV